MDWTTTTHPLSDANAQRQWQALWDISPQRTVFSSLAYARAAAEAFDLHADMHLVADQDGDVEAGAIIYGRRRGPYRQGLIPPMTQYSPLLLRTLPRETDIHYRRSAFEALLASLEDDYHHLRLFCPGLPDVRVGQWRGWTTTPFYTYRISLDTQEDLLSDWSSSSRSTYRKHQASYEIEERSDTAGAIVALCAAGYERHGRSLPADRQALQSLMDDLHRQGQLRLLTASPTGSTSVEAGIAVLHDDRMAHYWIAGSEPGPAMTVLIGAVLEQLQDEQFLHFDFVGANTPSIAEFKRRFGPTLVPYYLLETFTRPELRLLNALRR
ncbi:MAG: GNAT family N-acetyltransferase [Bacteroidetes bacterium]|jgi:hypothetical protein|nr:GNAT family N-acetyltransferase [Bacteroidota bacterium]